MGRGPELTLKCSQVGGGGKTRKDNALRIRVGKKKKSPRKELLANLSDIRAN